MDIGFLEDYFRLKYEDFVQENIFVGAEYQELRLKAYEAICELEKRLQPIDRELVVLMNQVLDNLSDKERYLIERSYLQGAFDRERMLK